MRGSADEMRNESIYERFFEQVKARANEPVETETERASTWLKAARARASSALPSISNKQKAYWTSRYSLRIPRSALRAGPPLPRKLAHTHTEEGPPISRPTHTHPHRMPSYSQACEPGILQPPCRRSEKELPPSILPRET